MTAIRPCPRAVGAHRQIFSFSFFHDEQPITFQAQQSEALAPVLIYLLQF